MRGCVVAGLDFTDADGPAFDLAGRIVMRAPGSQIHLVHVFHHPPSAEKSRDLIEHLRLYVDEKRAVEKTLSGVTVGVHLRGGDAVRELLQFATEVSADFIVVGSHPGLHVGDWLRGSTVERLVNSGAFPVLVAKTAVEPAKQEPTIEPPCPDCVAARTASGGERWWCERHSHSAAAVTSTRTSASLRWRRTTPRSRRPGSTSEIMLGLIRAMLSGIDRARTFGLAAEMSFWLFLSLVPLAAVAGLVAARSAALHNDWLASSLFSSVPPSARDLLSAQVALVAAWGNGVAPLAVGMFLWLASSGVHSVFDALAVQSGTSRPWWQKRLLALGTCVALSAGLAVLALLGAGLERIQQFVGGSLPAFVLTAEHGVVGRLLRWLAGTVVAVAMVAGLYRAGIGRHPRERWSVLPGAVLAVGLMALLGRGYAFYIARMGAGDAYSAGLTVVGVTLMTLWLFSVALLLGVQLNRVLSERRLRASPA